MTLQSSGQISLNDIHLELSGTTQTQVSLNDTDVRALISSTASTEVDFADFYGATAGGGAAAEWTLLDTVTGENASWSTHTISSSTMNGLAGEEGRIVLVYQLGNNTTYQSFTADIQVDDIDVLTSDGAVEYSFENTNESWETTTSSINGSFGYDITSGTTYDDLTFAAVSVNTTTRRWNVDTNGTPSSGTGLTTADAGSYYLYAESSSNNYQGVLVARSPVITLASSSPTLSYAEARSGGNIGTLKVYFKLEEAEETPAETATLVYLGEAINATSSTTYTSYYVAYPSAAQNKTGRLVVYYASGSSFTGDLQLDEVYYNATSATQGGTDLQLEVVGSTSGTQVGSTLYTRSTTPAISTLQTDYNSETTWTNLASGTTSGTWNIDANGTGSSGTGLTTLAGTGADYVYFETSGGGRPNKQRFLRSKEFTTGSSGGIAARIGHYGATIGVLRFYFVYET